MKTKHTPGPWKAHYNVPTAVIPGHIIKRDDDVAQPIASLWEGGGVHGKDEQLANARLIAAAPELLEAAKDALQVIEACVDLKKGGDTEKVLRRIIAKAEGK